MAIIIKNATIKDLIKSLQDVAMLRGNEICVLVPDGRDYGDYEKHLEIEITKTTGTEHVVISGISDEEVSSRQSEVS